MTVLPLRLSRAQARRCESPGLWARMTAALALRQQRLDLANLDDHLLRDIGVTRAEARTEAARAPWDAPENWLK